VDISDTLAPKSDQLDAVDLLGGARTFTIERVSRGTAEQPVNIHLAEFPRPWRPSKSMRRVLAASWGVDASVYVGRRIQLYCDPDVEYGGQAVGGTRIAALSHLDKPKQVPLLVKRGRSAIFTVQPLPAVTEPAAAETGKVSDQQLGDINKGLEVLGITERETKLAAVAQVVDRELGSARDLTADEAVAVLAWIDTEVNA